MKVPLSAVLLDNKIIVHRNGLSEDISFPFKPFILLERGKTNLECGNLIETWTKIPEGTDTEYVKLEFDSIKELNTFKSREDVRNQMRYIMYNSPREQFFISAENFLLPFPHTNDLVVMYWDIEVATKGDGFFPKSTNNEILCIGYSIWHYKNDGTKVKIVQKNITCFDIENMSDRQIISEFIDDIKKYDPDIMAGYNVNEFDWPYLRDRCNINGIDTKLFSRGQSKQLYIEKDVVIPGRINFDLYNSNAGSIKDQTLFGLKSRSLKIVARFYKAKRTVFWDGEWHEEEMEDIELPEEIENLLKLYKENPQRLYDYLNDDIFRTECVGHVYLRNCITLAEMMGVPLDAIMNMYSSFIPKLFMARNMEKLRLINTETNFNKYNFQNGSVAKLGTKYQGALVGIYKRGMFNNVYKLDFKSMYPSSIQTWNLGPDTTSIVRVIQGPMYNNKPCTPDPDYKGVYKCAITNGFNFYRIPTTFEKGAFAYDLIVKVRNDKEGFLKKEIKRLKQERVKIKKELRTCSPDQKEALDSQQYAIKVILNSIYGAMGLKSSTHGDMISATMVTAMCRWATGHVIWKYKDKLIELDTDGLILTEKVEEKEVNTWLTQLIKERFNIDDNYMEMELEEFGRAYFLAMKNYIVQDGEKYKIHGSSIFSSRAAHVVDRAINLAIEYWFNNKPKEEVLFEALNFKDLTIEDFELRVKLSKDQGEYSDPLAMQLSLARQMEEKTKQVATAGTQLSYVVTKKPVKGFEAYSRGNWNYTFSKYVTSVNELDLRYYKESIEKILEKFGIKEENQTNFLDLLLGDAELTDPTLDKVEPVREEV